MSDFTLDALREEADRKFAPTRIDVGGGVVVELESALRLPKNKRAKVQELEAEISSLQEKEGTTIEDLIALIHELFRQVAKKDANKLISALGDDIGVTLSVMEKYSEGTQLGEA